MYLISDWSREHEELQGQITRPIHEYDETTPEGKARMDRLREQLAWSKRFFMPPVAHTNM